MSNTPPLPSVPYVVWPILNFASASRRMHAYFGDKDHDSGLIWGTEDPVSAVKSLELDMPSTIPTSTTVSLRPSLSSSPLPTLPETSMAGFSPHTSTVAPAPAVFSFDAPAPTLVACSSSAACHFSAVIFVFADLGAGSSSGAGVVLVEQSSTVLVPASSILSHFCAAATSAGSLPHGTSDAGVSDTATLRRQLAVVRCQLDAVRHVQFSVWAELHEVRDEKNELCFALTLLHGSFRDSRLSWLPLMSRLDTKTSQFSPSDDTHDSLPYFLFVSL